ncbi:RrF2 family transcriptional regulator [Sphingobacterium humi]|uniref:Rrf2 family transcriptional regulator n=1 Tax=Sphingobacterium humi TaxID=1796905 RepID=A0A6N8KSV0_9SPHI|nr:Rrf2 family transcriptional regulator [Sphingobacterium humi]MVZ60513.1 Rrf2 family transcriptional regulator [Sphingobacterium humi]
MFSKACEHGLKAILYIATQSMDGKRVKIGEVAEHTATPEAFTAKVLGTLTKFNILKSVKGPYGGFEMSEEQIHGVRLADIVKAIDGEELFIGCALGLRECNAKRPCPMHHRFVEIRKELKSMMESSTVYDLATDVIAGESVLKTH